MKSRFTVAEGPGPIPYWEWREGKRPPGWFGSAEAEARGERRDGSDDFNSVPGAPRERRFALDDINPAALEVVSIEDFAADEEQGAAPLVGDAEGAVIPESGDVMMYGDGGAGKTTLANDLACHLGAGDDWLGIPVTRPVRVLLIENEGPRPLFRKKLGRKLVGWQGSPLRGRVDVLATPWARFTFAEAAHRDLLARTIRERETDVVIVGPLTASGMTEAGTLQEVRRFLALAAAVRDGSGRLVTFVFVHHENKGGTVSGAWEGCGDTMLHVQGQGHGRTRLYFQKTRWSSAHHATSLNLLWTEEGEGFTVEDKPELDDDAVAATMLDYVRENPGTGWRRVEAAAKASALARTRCGPSATGCSPAGSSSTSARTGPH